MATDISTDLPVYWGVDWVARGQASKDKEPPVRPETVPYLMELATQLDGMGDQQRPAIKYIIQEFSLEKRSRIARAREHKEEEAEKKLAGKSLNDLYKTNKGLILELLMASLMYRLDTPIVSRANCYLFLKMPSDHAPPGYPDVTVNYSNGFILHVEASANKVIDQEYFYYELESTLEHMKTHHVDWALLVTPWDYQKGKKTDAYKAFMHKFQEELTQRSIIIMSITEMAQIASTLAADLDFQFGTKRLTGNNTLTLFETLRDSLQEDKVELAKVWTETALELLNPNKVKKDKTEPAARPAP